MRLGQKASIETRLKMSISRIKNSTNYWSLHKWVAKEKGYPKQCVNCGLDDPGRRYEWANISGNYLRELDDYERLCVPCHRKKDGHNKLYEYSSRYQRRGNHVVE